MRSFFGTLLGVAVALGFLTSMVSAWQFGPLKGSAQDASSVASPQEASPPTASELNAASLFDGAKSFMAAAPSEAATPSKPLGAAQPHATPVEDFYDGLEYRWRNLHFRPAEFKVEAFLLVGLFGVIAWGLIGRSSNGHRATTLWKTVLPWLQSEFAKVGADEANALSADGPQRYTGYATGRRGCSALTMRIELRPRQDPISLFYELVRGVLDSGWTGAEDRAVAEWRIPPKVENGREVGEFDPKDAWVFAIVNKRQMNNLRSERWDIRTFTEVKETPLLPSRFVLMSESGDVTDALLKRRDAGVVDLLASHSEALQYLDSLIISGTRITEPSDADLPIQSAPKVRFLTLSLRLPAPSSSPLLLPLLRSTSQLIDALDRGHISLPALAASEISKRRHDVSEQLLVEANKENAEKKEEARRKKLKQAQDDKLSKMTPAQQEKHRERERKRNAQRSQQKMSVKRK